MIAALRCGRTLAAALVIATTLNAVRLSATAQAPASTVPPAVPTALAEVDRSLDDADQLLLQGDRSQAQARLDDAQRRLDTLHQEAGGQLPIGYVPLFVAEERLGALKRQIENPPTR